MTVRLLRIILVLIKKYYVLLSTECEIFLSMLVRFLDADKPLWQRISAAEVLHGLSSHPDLLRSFCHYYDMQPHSTKVFQDTVNATASFMQSIFQAGSLGDKDKGGLPPPANSSGKTFLLEMLDKNESPAATESHAVAVAFGCLLDITKSISSLIQMPPAGAGASAADAGPDDESAYTRSSMDASEGWWGWGRDVSLSLSLITCLTPTITPPPPHTHTFLLQKRKRSRCSRSW